MFGPNTDKEPIGVSTPFPVTIVLGFESSDEAFTLIVEASTPSDIANFKRQGSSSRITSVDSMVTIEVFDGFWRVSVERVN